MVTDRQMDKDLHIILISVIPAHSVKLGVGGASSSRSASLHREFHISLNYSVGYCLQNTYLHVYIYTHTEIETTFT